MPRANGRPTQQQAIAQLLQDLVEALRQKDPELRGLLLRLCKVWSRVADDLRGLDDIPLHESRDAVDALLDSPDLGRALIGIYSALGLPEQLASAMTQQLRTITSTIRRERLFDPQPLGKLGLVVGIGSVRGQICTLADLLRAERDSAVPANPAVRAKSLRTAVWALGALQAVLVYTSSVDPQSAADNLDAWWVQPAQGVASYVFQAATEREGLFIATMVPALELRPLEAEIRFPTPGRGVGLF